MANTLWTVLRPAYSNAPAPCDANRQAPDLPRLRNSVSTRAYDGYLRAHGITSFLSRTAEHSGQLLANPRIEQAIRSFRADSPPVFLQLKL